MPMLFSILTIMVTMLDCIILYLHQLSNIWEQEPLM